MVHQGFSLEHVTTWLASGTALAAMACLAIVRLRRTAPPRREWSRLLRQLYRSEEGAAYTVSVALTLPLFSMLIALFVEGTMLAIGQLGVSYAAFSGARSASVWYGADVSIDVAAQQVKRAVFNDAVAFVSGDPRWDAPGSSSGDGNDAEALAQQFAEWSGDPWSMRDKVAAKRRHAAAAVKVDDSIYHSLSANPNAAVPSEASVTVTYACPIVVPFMGPILGEPTAGPGGPSYSRTLTATATFEVERPTHESNGAKSPREHSLGIRYDVIH